MDFFKNIILKKDVLGNAALIEQPGSLHIAFGIDANFTIGTGALIYSILQHNKANFVFHIFTDNIYREDILRFQQLCTANSNICINIYCVNPQNFSALPTFFTWSQAMYYRFLISEGLPKNVDTVLYLDSDILCLQDFTELFSHRFADKIAAVVPDSPYMIEYAKQNFDFQNPYYFNSGFMLINLQNWRKNDISAKAIELLLQKNNFKFYDQDVLNLLLTGYTDTLPKKYNTVYHLADMNENIAKDTVFLHYSGSVKPWQLWGQYHFLTPLWLRYKNASPWKDMPIARPSNYKQAKFMARMSRRNDKLLTSLYWYTKYSLWKLQTKISS